MAVSLRLARHGSNKRPYYRIVAADSAKPRDGRYLEVLGYYHPLEKEDEMVKINKERVKHWLDCGARVSDTVKNLIAKQGIV